MKKYLFLILSLVSFSVHAITVLDDTKQTVFLDKPATRIISMSPFITEFLFEVGAGSKIVGITKYSDYPEEAKQIELVGDYRQVDVERIIALKPDLVVAWKSGYPTSQVKLLQEKGIPVFFSDPKTLEDIAQNYRHLSQLVGTDSLGEKKADAFEKALFKLKKTYEGKRKLSVFFQVSERPLYTLNGKHIVSEAMKICGAQNSFSDLKTLAPQISIEAVLERNPDVIIGKSSWKDFQTLKASQTQSIYHINDDWIARPGPRFIKAVQKLCEIIDETRKK